jgi:hypothetical protein
MAPVFCGFDAHKAMTLKQVVQIKAEKWNRMTTVGTRQIVPNFVL